MQHPGSGKTDSSRAGERRWWAAAEAGLVFLVYFVQGAWAAPDVNESHYLSKAKHYWDASWCANDFFCNTADAHQVFYWTFGWLSLWLPLGAMAWCGRIATWVLLAWAWRRLSWVLVPARWYAVLSAALFVTFNDRMHMAGEWVIGGVEAKGFAYVFVLLGLEALALGRYGLCLLALGAASGLHVIVGGWDVLALAIVWASDRNRPPPAHLVWPLVGGLLLALPGLASAAALTWHAPSDVVREANDIYVFERLHHHLLPQKMPTVFILRHLLLVAALAGLVWWAPPSRAMDRLRAFVAAAVGISAVGMAISLLVGFDADWAAALLRYYWFRASDVMVPLGMALIVCAILRQWEITRPAWHAVGLTAALVVAAAHLLQCVWFRHLDNRPPADFNIANLEGWREVCAWAAAETPPEAVFLTPRLAQTFRWYAGRAEVVNRKDLPQDAAGIVEWWRRNRRVYGAPPADGAAWRDSLAELGAERLRALGKEFGAKYAITSAYPPLALERVGPNGASFAVYRLSDDAETTRRSETGESLSGP